MNLKQFLNKLRSPVGLGQVHMDSKLLSITLFVGWISGCVQSSSPFPYHNGKSGIKNPFYKRPTFYYASFFILLHSTIYVSNMPQHLAHYRKQPTSGTIMNFTTSVVWNLSQLAIRIYLLWKSSAILKTLENLLHLESAYAKQTVSCSKVWTTLTSILILASCGRSTSAFVREQVLEYKIVSDSIGGGGATIESRLLSNLVSLIIEASDASSKIVSYGLILLVGQKLAQHYKQFIAEFCGEMLQVESIEVKQVQLVQELKVKANTNPKIAGASSQLSLVHKFEAIQQSFTLYSKANGFLLLVVIVSNTILSLSDANVMFQVNPTNLSFLERIFGVGEGVLAIGLIAHLGQTMKGMVSFEHKI